MTATTPDQLRKLADQARGYGTPVDTITAMQDNLRLAADTLAAVTAERGQARQMLADAPHEDACGTDIGDGACDCWKAGL